jgi:MFS family permease
MHAPLFTARFFTMCAYSFTVFVSLFQLLPTAPYRVIALGGTTAAAGLFLGLLTFASALSAPFTGPIGDRLGHRRVLVAVSLVLMVCSAGYAVITSYKVMLMVVVLHGLFWSGLLTASAAYMTGTVPEHRRAEGLSYWGLTSVAAIALAPALGFSVYRHGWGALSVELVLLNLLMAIIAWRLPDDRTVGPTHGAPGAPPHPSGIRHPAPGPARSVVEWRVLALSGGMGLIAFGYGSLTSFAALYADALGVTPRSVFFTAMAGSILIGRLTIGRTIDRLGHRRVLVPCLLAPALGLALLALAEGRVMMIAAAVAFGSGFGLMHPAYSAYIMGHVPATRRGAAFGAMMAAFDTGIGMGSTVMGWLVHHFDYRMAFATAAALATLSLPYFLVAERRLGFRTPS